MAKTKLTWDFPQTIHTVTVLPSEVARAHTPVTRPLVLHNCLYGYNEQGALTKTLYCTRSVRFFTHEKDGWREQLPCTHLVRRGRVNAYPKAGGGFDTAYMRHFGDSKCYRLIAYAFCEHPEEANTDPEWYKGGHGFEVDHLNGDHSNSSPDNLQWVTTDENRRRAMITRRLRKMAIHPKWVYIRNLKALYRLTDHAQLEFFTMLDARMLNDDRQLTIEAINEIIAQTLDICYTTI